MPLNPDERIELDLRPKETETGRWETLLDHIGLEAAPGWFNWLRWVLTLSVFQFLYRQSHSRLLLLIVTVSYGMLFLYFWGFYYRLDFKGLPFASSPRAARGSSIVLSGVLFMITWQLITSLVRTVAALQSAAK